MIGGPERACVGPTLVREERRNQEVSLVLNLSGPTGRLKADVSTAGLSRCGIDVNSTSH